MWHWGGWGWGHGAFGFPFLWLGFRGIIVAAVVVAVVFVARSFSRTGGWRSHPRNRRWTYSRSATRAARSRKNSTRK